jgi:predicted aminopeptidase
LRLPVNGHYRSYADLGRPYAVWNVEAAPEFSMEPKRWWYPVVGSLDYRGYFSERGAQRYAVKLRVKGYDAAVRGVEAYSTLGWFKDPVLNTFIFHAESDLAETIFHELAHQRVFARSDTEFDEAFATFVGEEGTRRWLRRNACPGALEEYERRLVRSDQFARLILETRARLEGLYGEVRTAEGRLRSAVPAGSLAPDVIRAKKQRIIADLRESYAGLKVGWGGSAEYDGWFAGDINNAQINSVAAYHDLALGFERLLAFEGGDLERFYAAVEKGTKKFKAERHQWLRALAEEGAGKRK